MFGIGMVQMLDQVFWNLPFASAKQATVVREKFNYPEADWQAKREELEKEHKADGPGTSCGLASCNGLARLSVRLHPLESRQRVWPLLSSMMMRRDKSSEPRVAIWLHACSQTIKAT